MSRTVDTDAIRADIEMAQRSPEMMRHVVFDHSAQLCDALDVVRTEVGRLRSEAVELKSYQCDRVNGLDVHQWVSIANRRQEFLRAANAERDAARATIRTLLDMAVTADVIDEGYAAEVRTALGGEHAS